MPPTNESPVLFINPMQFVRIIKRRMTRQKIAHSEQQHEVEGHHLWWQAYISLISSSSSKSPIFTTISNALEYELGIPASRYLSDDVICKRISKKLHQLNTSLQVDKPELAETLEIKGNIFKVLITIEEQLGFQIATLGWSCVTLLLSVG